MKLSVAIPTHQMPNAEYLFRRCLDSLWNQSFQDFEIVVTDNSDDNVIEDLCKFWYGTGVKYYRNPNKGMAQNTNEAIRRSKGELIKILYMDDYMAHDDALMKVVRAFKGQWLVSACTHIRTGENYTHTIHYPKYTHEICNGVNTIGSPSVLTIKNSKVPLLFDENMTWLLDCDYYKRMYEMHNEPVLLKDINVVIGLHSGQATNTMGDERKLLEHEYIISKYDE